MVISPRNMQQGTYINTLSALALTFKIKLSINAKVINDDRDSDAVLFPVDGLSYSTRSVILKNVISVLMFVNDFG